MARHRAPGTSTSYKARKTGSLGNRTSLSMHNLGKGGTGSKNLGPGLLVLIVIAYLIFGWVRGCTA